jgi:hypothetical protein
MAANAAVALEIQIANLSRACSLLRATLRGFWMFLAVQSSVEGEKKEKLRGKGYREEKIRY